jgi:hypothetical protein
VYNNSFISNWDDYISRPRLIEYIKSKLINFSKDGIEVYYSFGVDKRKLVSGREATWNGHATGAYLQHIQTRSPYAKEIYYVKISTKYKFYFFDDEQIMNFNKYLYFFPMSDNMIYYFTSESNIGGQDFGKLYDSPNKNKWRTIEFEKFIELLQNPIRIKKP